MIASRSFRPVLALAAVTAYLVPTPARAHFILQSPPAAHDQDDYGDPQKAPPCGDAGNAVPTGEVTAYQAGDKITITIDETIYHPGHYRIALAVNDISELPEEPPVTPNNSPCGTAPIQNPAVFPVLADGVFEHTEPFSEPQSFEITVPDGVNCDNCTLQVIQFMSNHGLNNPGGCYYHHCATIAIQGGQTTTTGDETGDETGEASSSATASSPATTQAEESGNPTDSPGSTSSAGDASDATSAGSASTGEEPTTAATAPNTTAETTPGATTDGDDDKGCACTATSDRGLAPLLGLLGLLGLRRRR